MSAKRSQPAADKLKMAQVAEQAGVSKQTIEYYIMLGLLQPRTDPKTRRRQFNASHVKRIKLIKQLNKSGYTLAEIRQTWLKTQR